MSPSAKRRKVMPKGDDNDWTPDRRLVSLSRDITPPQAKTIRAATTIEKPTSSLEHSESTVSRTATCTLEDVESTERNTPNPLESLSGPTVGLQHTDGSYQNPSRGKGAVYLEPPFRLTRIRNLPSRANANTVGLNDVLGNPLIKECWIFDYLFDLDFLMTAFDPDVRQLVNVKIIHGSWKRDDAHRNHLEDQSQKYPNIALICAHMPEAFGTHHSKMMVLFNHDDTAQVIIHTANMIMQDWANLTQGLWMSPVLPLSACAESLEDMPIGSGLRFKSDLLRYLKAYEGRTKNLVQQLTQYDFSAVRAALVASVPSRQSLSSADPDHATSWGWVGLKEVLSHIPCNPSPHQDNERSIIATQISSVATLTEKWLSHFFGVLDTLKPAPRSPSSSSRPQKSTHAIVFPTAAEVRASLDGYAAGGSIHWRLQSAAQQKQLALMKPMLHRWSDLTAAELQTAAESYQPFSLNEGQDAKPRDALRGLAAPHIKTYTRFRTAAQDSIHWALLTSANLSQQAWGALPSAPSGFGSKGRGGNTAEETVRICSYEIGVVVWPELFADTDGEEVEMVPVLGRDDFPSSVSSALSSGSGTKKIIPLRMPYSLPLVPYNSEEVPWCATGIHRAPDRFGRVCGVESMGFEVDE